MKAVLILTISFFGLIASASNDGIIATCRVIDPSTNKFAELTLPLEQSQSQPEYVERMGRFELDGRKGFVQVWGRTVDKLWKKLTVKGVRGAATPLEKSHVVSGLALECVASQGI